MADFLEKLELSVRAINVLRANEVTTPQLFFNLTQKHFLSFKGAGRRSWYEVAEVQANYHREWKREEEKQKRQKRRETLAGRGALALRTLNEVLPELHQAGWFIRQDHTGKYRLARYAITEDFDEQPTPSAV